MQDLTGKIIAARKAGAALMQLMLKLETDGHILPAGTERPVVLQLQKLQAELQEKDIHIAELDQTVANLNTSITSLKEETANKAATIVAQDKQINTAWYVFGTKKELQSQNIYEKGRVLQSNFNKNYFTKIDIRIVKEIKLYSKSVKIMTAHPANSYQLIQDANKQYVLRINNPQNFWSTSKYLVVLVK